MTIPAEPIGVNKKTYVLDRTKHGRPNEHRDISNNIAI